MRRSHRTKHRRFSKAIGILLLFLTVTIAFFELRLKPLTSAVAAVQAQAITTELINRSVCEVLSESSVHTEDLETVIFSESKAVTAIQSDTVTTNRLKNEITLKIQRSLAGIRSHQVSIPLGTILGGELLSGIGPDFPLCISLSGNVVSDFVSTFEEGGVNQTVHKLSVNITADVNILMPLNSVSTTVNTSVLIAETVIVGTVPSGILLHPS